MDESPTFGRFYTTVHKLHLLALRRERARARCHSQQFADMLAAKSRSIIASAFGLRSRSFQIKSSCLLPGQSGKGARRGGSSPPVRIQRSIRHESALVLAAISCKSEVLSTFGALEVQRIPCLSDNYAWLIRDQGSAKTAIVDPSESGETHPVLFVLVKVSWSW